MSNSHDSAKLTSWLGLQQVGLGYQAVTRLAKYLGNVEKVWLANEEQLRATDASKDLVQTIIQGRQRTNLAALISSLPRDVTTLTPDDNRYPRQLLATHSPPLALFVRGHAEVLSRPSLTAVGTRSATPYGLEATRRLLEPLAQAGVVIVSGLAFGIDAAAHQAALRVKGSTVAVLGNAIDRVYPTAHSGLASQILHHGGAIVSEYPPGTQTQRHFFPQRNRILAGLSEATLVVEAGQTSGALITAKMALEEGRDVLAVPGPITSERSAGTHELLRHGATIATSADDLRALYRLDMQQTLTENSHIANLTDNEAQVLDLLTSPRDVDELVAISRLDTSVVNATLSLLELKGYIRCLGDTQYVRIE